MVQQDNFKEKLRSCCIIPQRYILCFIGLLGVCNAYTMRVCLNLAITQMVKRAETSSEGIVDLNVCPSDVIFEEDIVQNTTSPLIDKVPYSTYDWDEKTQGWILSGFYYGYAVTQIPGGYLSERYGGKWTLGLGLLSTAIFTFLTPAVVKAGGATWLFILRVLQGLGEGPTVPGLMAVLARWAPPNERAVMMAAVFGGGQIGNIFGSLMSGVLLADNRDWAYVFYFFGGFGVLWFILWSLFCFSTPHTHPYISKSEMVYLNDNVIIADNKSNKDQIPWKAILRSGPVWAIVLGMIGHDWGYYTMVTELPKYATQVLKFNIMTTGALTALPFVALWVSSWIFAFICDYCINHNWHSIKTGRIIHTTLASTGPAIFLVLASYSGCNRYLAMVYFILSMAFMGGFYSGIKCNGLDIAPNYAGTIAAAVNTVSTLAGIVMPILVGYLTPDSTLAQWRLVFWVCFAILVGTNIIFAVLASGHQQWWDDVRKFGYPTNWKRGPLKLAKDEDKTINNSVSDIKVA